VQLGGAEFVQHARGRHDEDALGRLAGGVRERPCQEGFARARDAEKERVDTFLDEGEIHEREIRSFDLLATRIEVEVEGVDRVDLWKASVTHSPVDRAPNARSLLFVGESVRDIDRGEILLGGELEDLADARRHTWQAQPTEFLNEYVDLIVIVLLHRVGPLQADRLGRWF
jgi:hypothetical protein